MNSVASVEITPAIRKWKPYPAYKNSGSDLLDKIPAHWGTALLKREFSVRLGKMLQSAPTTAKDTLEPYLRAANIFWEGVNTADIKEMWFSPEEKKHYALEQGDLLVSEGGDAGRSALWREEVKTCYIQNAINRVRSKQVHSTYFLYYWMYTLKHSGYIDMLCSKATISHFTAEKVEVIPVVLPPLEDEELIVSFLDRETAKIDALVEKKERLIELLQEKRAAIITQAVTKGLDPDVPMKDSGIEWLGKVPTHWEVKRFRFLVRSGTQNGLHKAQEFYNDDGVPIFSMAEAFVSPVIDSTAKNRLRLTQEEIRSYTLRRGDLLFARRSLVFEGSGKCSMVGDLPEPHIFESSIIRVTTNKDLIEESFALLFLNSAGGRFQILSVTKQVTISGVDSEGLKDLSLVVPPIEEQRTVVNYLAQETAKIDALIAKVVEGIEKLKEYRTALISAAVTGKIDVREEVPTASQHLS